MNSSENKNNGDATFLNCFWRSITFKRIALLNGVDSGLLFLKTYAIYYFFMTVIGALSSLLFGTFELRTMPTDMIYYLIKLIPNALGVFFVCFILNLFLADRIMRVVNIFTFSRVYGWLLDILILIYTKYKKYDSLLKHVGVKEILVTLKYLQRGRLTPEEEALKARIGEYAKFGLYISIFYMFTFITFIVLLIRNIRALRKK